MKRKFSKVRRNKNKFWKRGDLTRVSEISGIRLPTVSGIFHRDLGVSPGRALILVGAIREVTKQEIPVMDLIFNRTSKAPCFF